LEIFSFYNFGIYRGGIHMFLCAILGFGILNVPF